MMLVQCCLCVHIQESWFSCKIKSLLFLRMVLNRILRVIKLPKRLQTSFAASNLDTFLLSPEGTEFPLLAAFLLPVIPPPDGPNGMIKRRSMRMYCRYRDTVTNGTSWCDVMIFFVKLYHSQISSSQEKASPANISPHWHSAQFYGITFFFSKLSWSFFSLLHFRSH